MGEDTFTLAELSREEADALTKDLQEVLAKHNCEMGVKSVIELLKRVPITPPEAPVVSTFLQEDKP